MVKTMMETAYKEGIDTFRPPERVVIRPPNEAASVLIRVTRGCDWNKCSFCGLYDVLYPINFGMRDVKDIKGDIDTLKRIADETIQISHKYGYAGKVEKNVRIAQVEFTMYQQCYFEEVKELSESDRGVNGFGSTGKK